MGRRGGGEGVLYDLLVFVFVIGSLSSSASCCVVSLFGWLLVVFSPGNRKPAEAVKERMPQPL